MEEKSASGSPEAAVVPWLVLPYGEGKINHSFYNICEPNNTTRRRKFIPELSRKRFWHKNSHKNWLIILCDSKDDDVDCDLSKNSEKDVNSVPVNWKYGDCFLWNPVTLETIQLPSLLVWISKPDEYRMLDCVLSSPPGIPYGSDGGEDPIVLFVFLLKNTKWNHVFLFCHPGDKKWRTQLYNQDTMFRIESLHCFKDKLYVIGFNEQHLEIKQPQQLGPNDDNVTLSIKPFNVSFCSSLAFRGARNNSWSLTYCMECDDEFFKIRIYFNGRGFEKIVVSIQITRLDFALMEWKVVNTLGDHVLFIGKNTRVCCSAVELGLAKGCLYYTLPEDPRLYKFEVESAGDSVIWSWLELPTPWYSPDWIMMPAGLGRKEVELGADEKDQDYILKMPEKKTDVNYCNETDDEDAIQCEKHNGQKLEERSPWGILNEDMVELIADYVHPLDYVHFRSVCKENRKILPVVKPTFSSAVQTIQRTDMSPWLLYSRNNNFTIFNLVNPLHDNEKYLMKFPELLLGATIRYQKGGWLLLAKEEKLFFYNPFTRETIKLGEFPGSHHMSEISFSSLPTSSDCVVFGVDWSGGGISIFSIRRGGQEWVEFEFGDVMTEEFLAMRNTPVLFNGIFYSAGYDGTLAHFSLEDDYLEPLVKPGKQFNDSYPSYLVECGEDLLLVKLGCVEMPVRIFRLDFSYMEWVKVESLGRYMLFVSGITCFSAVAPISRMENKLYSPRFCLNGEGVLFYSLETGCYQSFGTEHFAKDFCGTEGWLGNCTWIEPNWVKSTPQELDWFNSLTVA